MCLKDMKENPIKLKASRLRTGVPCDGPVWQLRIGKQPATQRISKSCSLWSFNGAWHTTLKINMQSPKFAKPTAQNPNPTSGTLVHPNSCMNSWNICFHIWKNHMNSQFLWIHIFMWIHVMNSCTWIYIHMNSYNHYMNSYLKWLYRFIYIWIRIWNDYMNSWVYEFI